MTEDERRIVEWLRGEAQDCINSSARRAAASIFAKRIERGDHRK